MGANDLHLISTIFVGVLMRTTHSESLFWETLKIVVPPNSPAIRVLLSAHLATKPHSPKHKISDEDAHQKLPRILVRIYVDFS